MLHEVIDALRRKGSDAVVLARAEVMAAPESADAHHLLGIALREAGDAGGARESFEKAIALAPDESLFHLSRALLAHVENDLAQADRSSSRAIALDPNQLGAYILRIQLALAARDPIEAERQLRLAERIAPDHPQMPWMAGQIAYIKGDLATATALLARASAAQPHDAHVLALLSAAYQRQGHHAFAEQTLRRAIALEPHRMDLRQRLLESLLVQRRLDDAGVELAQWREMHPDDPGIAVVESELQMKLDDPQAALAVLRSALSKSPEDVPALMALERALNAIGDRSLARDVWEEILGHNPQLDVVWGSRLQVADDRDEQSDVLRRWREAMPHSLATTLTQARLDEVSGLDAQAEAGYDAVLAQAPQQPDALFGKAMFERVRDPESSLDWLNALIASAPPARAVPALAIRGRILDGLDRHAEAVMDWRHAQAALGQPLPPLPLPDEALAALPASHAATGETSVVMLWGPPGSGSERIAAALRHAPSRPLMLASAMLQPRVLAFPDSLIARATDPVEMPAFAVEVAAEYARSTAPYTRQGNQGVFDWLARWDSRVVPMMRHALPNTRLIAVLRDPRDLLLNWLAFGAPAGPAFTDPFACAAWLANQLDHLLFSRDGLHLPVCILDMDRFDADPVAGMQAIAAFADLPTTPEPQPAVTRMTGPGRMPTLLAQGRWHAYRDLLANAFDVLAPVAERLGYASA